MCMCVYVCVCVCVIIAVRRFKPRLWKIRLWSEDFLVEKGNNEDKVCCLVAVVFFL